jgi:hypothetical protein
LAETNVNRKELIENPAALLRSLTDYATLGADLPSDRQHGTKIQARLSGSDLRVLLRRTAAQMTALGQESIAKGELERRLRTADLVGQVKEISKDKVISALLVSFYFKGGNTALGCEFTHKAFREYLFAEEVVEAIKMFARSMPDDLPERPASFYWKDFNEADPRRKAGIELATLLGPQWLSPEIVGYVGSLFEWEIDRTFSKAGSRDQAGATSPATPREWRRARTLLADLWDWWADGVHVRQQPREDEDTGQIKWDTSVAERLIPKCRPLTSTTIGGLPEPVRTTTLDAHLGDALFRLCSLVHYYLQPQSTSEQVSVVRRSQRLHDGKVMFRPTGSNPSYFPLLCARISAAGWRPDGAFPQFIFARGVDFFGTLLEDVRFERADLEGSIFSKASLNCTNFRLANLAHCVFFETYISFSDFMLARLDHASFSGCAVLGSRFNGASFKEASFDKVEWKRNAFFSVENHSEPWVRVPLNDFSDAIAISKSAVKGSPRWTSSRVRKPKQKDNRNKTETIRQKIRTQGQTAIKSEKEQ